MPSRAYGFPRILTAAACSVAVLVSGAPAGAAPSAYSVKALTEPARSGLAVTGALSDLVATSKARVLVPARWRQRRASAGRLRFTTTQNPSCHFALTYTVRSAITPVQSATDHVTAALPATSARHLLDSGERGSSAFRVVRRPGIGGRVRVDALWARVLTRRSDIVSDGRVAWTEIRVSAQSRKGDECHAGTWRESLGPDIGDSLAVARTRLHFTKAPSG